MSANALKRLEGYATEHEGLLDAYETELETGESQVWWVRSGNKPANRIQTRGKQHDVSRPMGMVFGVDHKVALGAAISPK